MMVVYLLVVALGDGNTVVFIDTKQIYFFTSKSQHVINPQDLKYHRVGVKNVCRVGNIIENTKKKKKNQIKSR